jgi:hypothetical protein
MSKAFGRARYSDRGVRGRPSHHLAACANDDKAAASKQYGKQTGSGSPYSFLVKGSGTVTEVDNNAAVGSFVCAALAGLILTSELGAAYPDTASTFELNAIAAAVLGGTSLFWRQGHHNRNHFGRLRPSASSVTDWCWSASRPCGNWLSKAR